MNKVLIVMMLICSSCALFKNQQSTRNETEMAREISSLSNMVAISQSDSLNQVFTQRKDSTSTDYLIRLWPRGNFSLSADGQVNGEFDSVIMSGRRGVLTNLIRLKHSGKHKYDSANVVSGVKTSTRAAKTSAIKKSGPNITVIGLGIAVLLGVVYFVLRNKFRVLY